MRPLGECPTPRSFYLSKVILSPLNLDGTKLLSGWSVKTFQGPSVRARLNSLIHPDRSSLCLTILTTLSSPHEHPHRNRL